MPAPAKRAIVIGMDGASMELVRNMMDWGHVPHIKSVYERGASRAMLGVFPTLTPPGWTAIATGSWPGTHEVMDFHIHSPGQRLTETTFGINTALARSEYFWNTVERAGGNPILVKWEMAWPPTMTTGTQVEGTGPGVANYHQLAGYHLFTAGKWAPRPIGGDRDPVTLDPSALQDVAEYDVISLAPASGWKNLPESAQQPLEAKLVVKPLARGMPELQRGAKGVPKTYYGLVYGGAGGYDRIRLTRSRDATDTIGDLRAGEWTDHVVDDFVIDGEALEGAFRFKLIGLSPSADELELFATQVWPTGGDYAVPGGTAEELHRAVGPFIQNPARDALGFFDDETYFELLDEHHLRLGEYAVHLGTTREWDVLFAETHASDYASHFFLGQADPISGADDATIARCREGLRRTWESIDLMVGKILELADDETVVVLVSDHGGTPSQHTPVDVNDVLRDAGLLTYAGDGRVDLARTQALGIGLVHVFLNVKGRETGGIVDLADYDAVQSRVIDALLDYRSPETGERPFTLALTRADAEVLNLSGELIGDVVYALKPGYDGAHGKQLPSVSFGIAGQHSTFILAGPGVKPGPLSRQVRAVDVVPTVAYLLGLPMPANVEGGVVYEALEDPNWPLTELGLMRQTSAA